MGRQTRQARRAQERRAQARGRQAAQRPDRKWVLAGVAVVLAAVALLVVFNATNTGTERSDRHANGHTGSVRRRHRLQPGRRGRDVPPTRTLDPDEQGKAGLDSCTDRL